MSHYAAVKKNLLESPKVWLVTGVAGFIGSNLLEQLLNLGQTVIGLDNFSTGHQHNLAKVKSVVGDAAWSKFTLIEGDTRDLENCRQATKCVDYVLHQAALGSVPRSLEDPINTHESNINGFLNMLVASRDAGIKRFVYAASSSTYGDHPGLPKIEDRIGKPLSPYAVTKYVNELYADVFGRCYGLQNMGLRYFNVFGPRQDPDGAYAAVIPKWFGSLLRDEAIYINGDGETSRDFCFIDNVVQMNILAATTENPEAINQVYNVAVGDRTTLNELYGLIREQVAGKFPQKAAVEAIYRDFRAGDVRHSQANVDKAKTLLAYEPTHTIREGMGVAAEYYLDAMAK